MQSSRNACNTMNSLPRGGHHVAANTQNGQASLREVDLQSSRDTHSTHLRQHEGQQRSARPVCAQSFGNGSGPSNTRRNNHGHVQAVVHQPVNPVFVEGSSRQGNHHDVVNPSARDPGRHQGSSRTHHVPSQARRSTAYFTSDEDNANRPPTVFTSSRQSNGMLGPDSDIFSD